MANEDAPRFKVTETIVLKKFDGDLTDEEMETAEPLETITLVDGKIVETTTREENG